jgi:TolB-like protein
MKNIIQPVTVYRWVETTGESGSGIADIDAAAPLPAEPSIAVLPFDNMSGDPEQEYFSDGITEDIITELSRFRQLFVIARNSSFTFKGQRVDVSEVASKLGVQYVVEGSVRKVGDRVRVTAQLIDAATGSHIWADRFDRMLDDIFAVQDEVVAAIVSTLPSQISKADLARQQRRPSDVRAYDLTLQAWNNMETMEGVQTAVALLEQALVIEPDYATAHSSLAAAYMLEVDYQAVLVTSTTAEKIMKHARRAVELDASDDRLFQLLSDCCLFVERDLVEARIHAEQAMSLNPNSTNTVAWMGYIYNCNGETELAKEYCERALRLDPLAPGWVKFLQGVVYFDAGEFDLAIGMFLASGWDEKWPHLAAAYALSGQLERARKIAMRQRESWKKINPENLDERIQVFLDVGGGWYTHGNQDGSFAKGVRLAGLIE